MQASLPGLGYEIFLAQRTFRSADLYAGLMTLGAFGFLINQALLLSRNVGSCGGRPHEHPHGQSCKHLQGRNT